MTPCELVQNQAVWHRSCHNKFNNDKVDRAVRKRDRNETTENIDSGLKRNRRQSMDKMACLLIFASKKMGTSMNSEH